MLTKKKKLAKLMDGYCDIHCHLLPGVDDGAKDNEHSAHLLRRMESMGVRSVYMTPHIINGTYGSKNGEMIKERFESFDNATGMDIRLAAEYFIDDMFLERLRKVPLTFSNKHILVETSLNSYSVNLLDILFEASLDGYQIIMAHPERYSFMYEDRKMLRRWLDNGYSMQLNLLSLTGYHGRAAQKMAHILLDNNCYSYVGTDVHNDSFIDAIESSSVPSRIYKTLEKLKANNEELF